MAGSADSSLTRRGLIAGGAAALAAVATTRAADAAAQAAPPPSTNSPWPERRRKIERAWLDLLGDFPREVPPLAPVMREVAVEEGITRYHVSFQADPDDRVTAWLLVPAAARRVRAPAIVCIHSTTFGAGKDSTIGLAGRRPQDPPRDPAIGVASGREYARHGFVTLSLDLLTDGERIQPGDRVMDTRPFYVRHPEWSMVGKNTWDVMRCVDFLQTLDFVDPEQIGCTGWSLGGHSAIFAAAFEPRIKAVLSNGGVLDWHRPANSWARPDDLQNSPELERRFGFKPNSGPYIYIRKFRP